MDFAKPSLSKGEWKNSAFLKAQNAHNFTYQTKHKASYGNILIFFFDNVRFKTVSHLFTIMHKFSFFLMLSSPPISSHVVFGTKITSSCLAVGFTSVIAFCITIKFKVKCSCILYSWTCRPAWGIRTYFWILESI